MKLRKQNILPCVAIPLFLLIAGCKEKTDSAVDNSSMSTLNTNAAATADADNSGKNVRDRNNAELTPGDQGNSATDRDITRKVRQMLVSGTNDYSMTAKNVKIITANGKVTLRGPVNNPAEKTAIEMLAKTVAGDTNVEDQLEVKTNP